MRVVGAGAPRSLLQDEGLAVLGEEGRRIAGIIVFVHDGYLSYLEVHASVAAEIDALPPVDRVRFHARTSPRREVLIGS